MSDSEAAGNLVPLSVTELSGALKRTIEDRFGLVRVRGEVSGWRGPHSSGHCYFSLKDQGARIDAVIWKGDRDIADELRSADGWSVEYEDDTWIVACRIASSGCGGPRS